MSASPILPSVSLRDDLSFPERLGHYRPTSRSNPIVASVLGKGATMVIASYGSGKSMAAGIGALVVDNDPANRSLLREIGDRIAGVDADLATEYLERVSLARRGGVVALSGHVADLPAAIGGALGLSAAVDLDAVLSAMRDLPLDHVAIVWDEFGRHLEGLAREGRTRDLDMLQRLAEWTHRAKAPTASLTLLMHQGLLAYAGALNEAGRNEWRKIEGRFRQLRFVEDSREIYALLADTIEARRPDAGHVVPRGTAADALAHGWFDGMPDPMGIEALLGRAAPVTAAALHVLPGIAGRVGQNQRSLFSFAETADLSGPVGALEVHAAFSEAMRTDVGVAGAHRRWVEAENALSRSSDAIEREAIAAAFLFQLGAAGERRRLSRAELEAAVRSKGFDASAVGRAVDALLDRKLLLHRKLTDDVCVWHGADVDIARRLLEERARRSGGFDAVRFLDGHHPAPFIRSVRHNMRTGTTRYATGRFLAAGDLAGLSRELPAGTWARIVYVLCDGEDEIASARSFAASAELDRTVIVIPREAVQIREVALEIEALSFLRRDEALLAEDPLAGQELDELLSVAGDHLRVALYRLTGEHGSCAEWWSGGRDLGVGSSSPAGLVLSNLMDAWFPATPRIANEQLMRGTISSQMRTNRVRMVTRLMERSAVPLLGYGDDTSAEASIYRTVLARTGLHVRDGGQARFAEPEEVPDPGLSSAWSEVKGFFTIPGRRSLSRIVDLLARPPYGLPDGVLPIIVMAGYRAFGRAVTIRTDGAFVSDVLGFASTKMFLDPERHEVEVHDGGGETIAFLEEVAFIFGGARPAMHEERLRYAWNALAAWRAGVADGVVRSGRLPGPGARLLRRLSASADPAHLLLVAIPGDLGGGDPAAALAALKEARDAVEGLARSYEHDAVETLLDVLRLDDGRPGPEGVGEWAACLDAAALMRRPDIRMTDRAVLRTAVQAAGGRETVGSLARAVSSILLQRGIEKWQDDTVWQFRKELRECRDRIESAALDGETPPACLEPILDARIRSLQNRLEAVRAARGGT